MIILLIRLKIQEDSSSEVCLKELAPYGCHNRSEHLSRINFQIIIALVNN